MWLIADIPDTYVMKEEEMGLTSQEKAQGGYYYYGFPEFIPLVQGVTITTQIRVKSLQLFTH